MLSIFVSVEDEMSQWLAVSTVATRPKGWNPLGTRVFSVSRVSVGEKLGSRKMDGDVAIVKNNGEDSERLLVHSSGSWGPRLL